MKVTAKMGCLCRYNNKSHYSNSDIPLHDHSLYTQITTHGHFLTPKELKDIGKRLSMEVVMFFLNQFDTELDFSNKVGYNCYSLMHDLT